MKAKVSDLVVGEVYRFAPHMPDKSKLKLPLHPQRGNSSTLLGYLEQRECFLLLDHQRSELDPKRWFLHVLGSKQVGFVSVYEGSVGSGFEAL